MVTAPRARQLAAHKLKQPSSTHRDLQVQLPRRHNRCSATYLDMQRERRSMLRRYTLEDRPDPPLQALLQLRIQV